MTIEKMDKAAVVKIAAATKAALDAVAEELGLSVKVGGESYDPTTGTFKPKIEFSLGDSERLSFEQLAPLFGLTAEDYGRVFEHRGTMYKLVGFNPRAPKFALLAERKDGKRFKFPEAVLKLKSNA